MADTPQHFPVKLTQPQRKVIAEIVPVLAGRLKLKERATSAPFSSRRQS